MLLPATLWYFLRNSKFLIRQLLGICYKNFLFRSFAENSTIAEKFISSSTSSETWIFLFHFAQFIVPYTGFLSKIKRDENISTLFLWEQLWKKQPQRISHEKFKEPSSTVVFPFFSDDKTDSTKVCFTPYCKNKLLKQENMTTIDQPPH